MPKKIAILPHLDNVSTECRSVGACNTVYIRHREDGTRILCGTNTDIVGIRESFVRNVYEPEAVYHDKPAVVIGGGGAARSAVYALRHWLHVTDIYIVCCDDGEARTLCEECEKNGYGQGLQHMATVQQAEAAMPAGAIVACVPDFPPRTDGEKLARRIIETILNKNGPRGVMLEMCYNPSPYTQLGKLAEKAGWQVILGNEALLWQGLEQVRFLFRPPALLNNLALARPVLYIR